MASTAAVVDASQEVLELSVSETNALRAKLGLAPLRVNKDIKDADGTSKGDDKVRHVPAPDTGAAASARARSDAVSSAREAEDALRRLGDRTLADETADDGGGALSWAARMRTRSTAAAATTTTTKTKTTTSAAEPDLSGVRVSHAASSFAADRTTVLTLADENILATNENRRVTGLNENVSDRLESVEMTNDRRARENLRKKRKLEVGRGHAGNYAAWDDDEFDELGGVGGRDDDRENGDKDDEEGFVIGQRPVAKKKPNERSSFFRSNREVSLEERPSTVVSDFMTVEEYEREQGSKKKKKKKEKGFKKKKKKDRSKHRRRKRDDDDDDDEEEEGGSGDEKNNEGQEAKPKKTSTLLQDLEATADDADGGAHRSKRRRDDNDEDEDDESRPLDVVSSTNVTQKRKEDDVDEEKLLRSRRARFDAIMEKANERSRRAFATTTTKSKISSLSRNKPRAGAERDDEEEERERRSDEAFLHASLEKARRLQRLRALQRQNNVEETKNVAETKAEAIAMEVRSSSTADAAPDKTKGGVTLEFDPTREFTRSLRADDDGRGAPSSSNRPRTSAPAASTDKDARKTDEKRKVKDEENEETKKDEDEDDDNDLEALAKHVPDDDDDDALAVTTIDPNNRLALNRGLSSALSLLSKTGSFAHANPGAKKSTIQERLRGRSKDHRNYSDYEALDLDKVTSVGSSRHRRDKELTEREVRLEYRDEFGRLLTSKEAYRQMCYQFHGHGSGKRNEERRLRTVERERREEAGAREGTLGALKATQRVTGKAFVVHKT